MKILLILPANVDDRDNVSTAALPYFTAVGVRSMITPLGIATIAALTPPEYSVAVHDEHVDGDVMKRLKRENFDILGCSTLTQTVNRALNIFKRCQEEGIPGLRVLGGAGAGAVPRASKVVDVIFMGEAEETWPRFLKEFSEGNHASFYRQVSKPDLSSSPPPRWELFDLKRYAVGGVQTTRGCPFDCAFCDVIYIFGRKPRHKPIPQVLEEVKRLEALGKSMIFFTDDDFVGDKKYTIELLRELVKLNQSFDVPLMYTTEADITMAGDKELLELMADANFIAVLVGIESPSEEALRDLNKLQNVRYGLRKGINEIQSYGILVWGYMIAGADTDDVTNFKKTEDFVLEMNLADHFCTILSAPEGTPLWYRLKQEGRIIDYQRSTSHRKDDAEFPATISFMTNIMPLKMTRVELMEGYADYLDRVFDPAHFIRRALGFIQNIQRIPQTRVNPVKAMSANRALAMSVFKHFTFGAPRQYRKAFWTLVVAAIRKNPSLLARASFLFTHYYFHHIKASIVAQDARAQARWERQHPGCIAVLGREIPVPRAFSENAREIVHHAYSVARVRVVHREPLFKALIDGLSDYIARWGEELLAFDEHHQEYVTSSMERALARLEGGSHDGSQPEMPQRPPAGLVREITDGLDLVLRTQGGNAEPAARASYA